MHDKGFPVMRKVIKFEGKRLCEVTYKSGTNSIWRLQWNAGGPKGVLRLEWTSLKMYIV